MVEEKKKRRILVRHIKKQSTSASNSNVPKEKNSNNSSNNVQRKKTNTKNYFRKNRNLKNNKSVRHTTGRPMPKTRRPINAGSASAPSETPNQQKKPIVRRIRRNPRNFHRRYNRYSHNKPTGNFANRNKFHKGLNNRYHNNKGENQRNGQPVSKVQSENRNALHRFHNASHNGSGLFGGALTSGNNSARNNTRRRGQNNFVTGPVRGKRRKSGPKGSKKAQKIAASSNKKHFTARKKQPLPKVLEYRSGMNVQDISKIIHRDTAEILKKLFLLGVVVNQNQSLDSDAIELLAEDYGIKSKQKKEVDVSDIDKFFDKNSSDIKKEDLVSRPPIVTIMGHVDHGKTTLLDYLRHTHVTAGEAGGITQHIGAYQARLKDRLITFLDTPGHAAFTEMRARGANITDVIVLVVAADDGVMPQTVEAINHAKAAKTPIIVAINKIDIPGVNVNNIKNELMKYGLVPEDNGGDTIEVPISAKSGKNVDKLLEMILLQADVMELKADPKVKARGSVVEARLDKGRGPVATVLIQQGTLHKGDPLVVGNTFGRVRTMSTAEEKNIKKAVPAQPVEITGINSVPQAGDHFVVMKTEKEARESGELRAKKAMEEQRNHKSAVTLNNLFSTMAKNKMKKVSLIIKADVQGSVEALDDALRKIKIKGVRVDIIHSAVGAINESDINLAEASDAIIIGFNVRPTGSTKKEAQQKNVDIRLYNVIYDAINEIKAAMKGKLEPTYKEKVIGSVEVQRLFHFSKVGTIAGCLVTEGQIKRDAKIRLIRDGVVVHKGAIGSLKHGKDDVNEEKKGSELGLTIKNYNDEKVGDIIEAYIMEEVKNNG